MDKSGLINVLKPPGMSSHDVVSFIRRVYGIKKVGHAGTLDPAASGVLPVAVGKATRLIEYMTDANKSYRAELTLGFETNTGDDTGDVIETLDAYSAPSKEKVLSVLNSFIGEIVQTPPMYSAIKVNGNKLCDLARKGINVDIPSRKVLIHNISLIKYENDKLLFDVDCSKGTYIRSLCIDIGRRLAIPATMSFLVRTKVGKFTLEKASIFEEISANFSSVVLDIDYAVRHMPAIHLSSAKILDFKEGRAINFESNEQCQFFRIYDTNQCFIGIGTYHSINRLLTAKKVIFR